MQIHNTDSKYGVIAQCLHWLIFVLIAGLLAVGFIMTEMENSPDKFKLYGLHKSAGIVVLTLAFFRLLWRLKNRVPILPNTLNALQKKLAHLGHYALYLLMFAMPISGWFMSSAAGFPVSVFGLFTLPDLLTPDKELGKQLAEVHELIGFTIIGLVSLHIIAALLHHFYYRDNVLQRMLPFQKRE